MYGGRGRRPSTGKRVQDEGLNEPGATGTGGSQGNARGRGRGGRGRGGKGGRGGRGGRGASTVARLPAHSSEEWPELAGAQSSSIAETFNSFRPMLQAAAAAAPREKLHSKCKTTTPGEVLAPGLVVLRDFLDAPTQKYLLDACFAHQGSLLHAGSFYSEEKQASGRSMFKLNMGSRGRLIDNVSAFPKTFSELAQAALQTAQKLDSTMPDMQPTTLLVNFYKPNATFNWHQDSEHPELKRRKAGKPIVSFSVGLDADFGVKRRYQDTDHQVIRLRSGDVLLFGGASRMLVHSVLRVIQGTTPAHLAGLMRPGRLNLTFRDTTDGVIDTTQFPRYRVCYEGDESKGVFDQ
mmetsp:Transcript_27295/g.53670  ORF Transcript_27295/g.53670 Transcript_27295/m.53670 type:complete len:350 (-) Transcript_27295:31-1080(-)